MDVSSVESTDVDALCECGKPEGSYACRIRHIQVNTGWAKAAND